MDNFTDEQLRTLAAEHGTPLFVYSRSALSERAAKLTELDLPFGLTPRYAVKANTHPDIIKQFFEAGLHFDASSDYEVYELLKQGIPGSSISLSSQQPTNHHLELFDAGVKYVATSMHQLERYCNAVPSDSTVGLRVNPGMGSGHNNRTTTGGVNSSFGLWHEYLDDALAMAANHQITITRLHVHIGSGADPELWAETIATALQLVRIMPDVTTLDIGGGYKISRFEGEPETDMSRIATVFSDALIDFEARTNRRLQLEIEPGTWLVGHAGVLLATVADMVDTGSQGHTFLRLNTGMNDIIRPSMYGAQHRIKVLSDIDEKHDYIVVGHYCETGDILTPAKGDPESLAARSLNKAEIGDLVAIYDAGAYCASFAVHGYNSFPSANEIII
jgi:diaminopimelate decarboxylase